MILIFNDYGDGEYVVNDNDGHDPGRCRTQCIVFLKREARSVVPSMPTSLQVSHIKRIPPVLTESLISPLLEVKSKGSKIRWHFYHGATGCSTIEK